jgi:hypothetical protein
MATYVLRLRENYLNAGGQKRAILLAGVIGKYRVDNTCIPDDFLNELDASGLLSDARGLKINIKAASNGGFEINYKPVISFYSIDRNRNPMLLIKWNADTKTMDVTSTIYKP